MSKVRLFNGDCLKVLASLPEGSIDLVVCDPPYSTTPYGSHGSMGGISKTKALKKGKGGFNHCELQIEDYLPLLMNVMKDKAHGYIMCNNKNLSRFLIAIHGAGFNIFKTLIWAKNTCITNMYYMDSHEYIIFFRKGKAKKINNCGTRSVIHCDIPRGKAHPSQKPVDLMKILVENSSNPGDVVLDFAMGVGTTGKACLETNRNFVGIELDKKYFNIAKKEVNNGN